MLTSSLSSTLVTYVRYRLMALPSLLDSRRVTPPNRAPFVSTESSRSPLPFPPKSPLQYTPRPSDFLAGVCSAATVFPSIPASPAAPRRPGSFSSRRRPPTSPLRPPSGQAASRPPLPELASDPRLSSAPVSHGRHHPSSSGHLRPPPSGQPRHSVPPLHLLAASRAGHLHLQRLPVRLLPNVLCPQRVR